MDLRHLRMPAAQSSTPPDRRLIAVGIIGRAASRTVTIIRTADGVTGTVANGCPICRRVVGCTCLTPTTPAPMAQPFDDDSDDACPLCGDWTCTCGTPTSYTDAARALHDEDCARCRALTQDTNARAAASGASMRRRDRLTLGLPRPAVTA